MSAAIDVLDVQKVVFAAWSHEYPGDDEYYSESYATRSTRGRFPGHVVFVPFAVSYSARWAAEREARAERKDREAEIDKLPVHVVAPGVRRRGRGRIAESGDEGSDTVTGRLESSSSSGAVTDEERRCSTVISSRAFVSQV
jgi:hypothetical protein